MIIVSQKKTNIINFENVNLIGVNMDGEIKIRLGVNDCALLGRYKTEERAKEVLREIITRCGNWENLKAGQPSGLCLPIYEMPED